MKIKINDETISFEVIEIEIKNRNQENIFLGNKKTLEYKLQKAINKPKDRLHKIAKNQKMKYKDYLDVELGKFLMHLKEINNPDFRLYLNKYGDSKYCNYTISKFKNDKGIYCYIVDDQIVYVGRSKKTFAERFKDYGKITPYNCLIDGQVTNCNINSKVNNLEKLKAGFYIMNDSSDKEIESLEKRVINSLKGNGGLWNVQKN